MGVAPACEVIATGATAAVLKSTSRPRCRRRYRRTTAAFAEAIVRPQAPDGFLRREHKRARRRLSSSKRSPCMLGAVPCWRSWPVATAGALRPVAMVQHQSVGVWIGEDAVWQTPVSNVSSAKLTPLSSSAPRDAAKSSTCRVRCPVRCGANPIPTVKNGPLKPRSTEACARFLDCRLSDDHRSLQRDRHTQAPRRSLSVHRGSEAAGRPLSMKRSARPGPPRPISLRGARRIRLAGRPGRPNHRWERNLTRPLSQTTPDERNI